jgi:hypothetical protein
MLQQEVDSRPEHTEQRRLVAVALAVDLDAINGLPVTRFVDVGMSVVHQRFDLREPGSLVARHKDCIVSQATEKHQRQGKDREAAVPRLRSDNCGGKDRRINDPRKPRHHFIASQ